ncbi:MAG: hypothetical protein SPF89_06200 [Sphaerochaetaceae bacterium]|nr:hypothetical protein [Spirochaetales bacterium]MDY5499675.1 hypothetical protein [Sphaerochaetaceae bacterium]
MKRLLPVVLALIAVAFPLCADPIVSTQSYELEGRNKRGSDTLSFTGYITEKISALDSFGAYWQGSVAASNGSSYSIANLGTTDEVKGTLLTWSATGTLGNSENSSLHLHFSLSISPLVGEDAETYVPGSVAFTREDTVYTRKGATLSRSVHGNTTVFLSGKKKIVSETVTETKSGSLDFSSLEDTKVWALDYTVNTLKGGGDSCTWKWGGSVDIDMQTTGLPAQNYHGTIILSVATK